MPATFRIARNPDAASRLPFLVRLPLPGPALVLRARETWPRTGSVYCYRADDAWPDAPDLVDEVTALVCERRGRAIDLVLDRGKENRSQFVFTTMKGREAIFWQTPKTVRGIRPSIRTPARRASRQGDLVIVADSRERYAYKFAAQQVTVERGALRAGDYAVQVDGVVVASVERKSVADLSKGLVDGSLNFRMMELAALPHAAVVVEGRYDDVLAAPHVAVGWLGDLLAQLQLRYASVPIVFAGSRKLAEEWTFRFLGAASAEAHGELMWGDPTAPA